MDHGCQLYIVYCRMIPYNLQGEPGQNAIKGPMDKDGAIKDFVKKFKDKTKNNWDDRLNFKPVPGKYTMIEMDDGGDEEDEAEMAKTVSRLFLSQYATPL